nr:preprotein translocase subunit SecY [Candidatus Njordarchaeum guaymaensis]
MVRFIDIFGSMARVIPNVKSPDRKVPFREKFGWTIVVLLIFLLMSNIPLYGIKQTGTIDYLYWMRVILASTHGTLMELGIGPIVTAGLIMQLLAGSKIIKTDMSNSEDRSKFTASQKSLAMLMTAIQAAAFIVSGAYGAGLSLIDQVVVFLQLFFAGLIVILLDEMTQKGWGLGSGVSLFIVANVAQQILWRSFSPIPAADGYWIGAVFATFQALFSGGLTGLGSVFFARPGASDAGSTLGLLVTVIVFIIVIYFETYRVNIPLQYAKFRGFRGSYPIKLLYVSNIPVILVQSLFATILFWTQIVAKENTGGVNPWTDLLAVFTKETDADGNVTYRPSGGLVYYITPPRDILAVVNSPIQAIVYLLLMVVLCAGFAKIWVELSGIAPRDIAGQLHSAGMQIPGFRRSPVIMEQVLSRYIPVVALLGGMIVGLLAVVADFFGALGTGMGVLLAVGIIYQLYQTIAQEQLSDMHPALRGLLGS